MSTLHSNEHPTDATLVAYLDGALSPSEHIRVAHSIASDHELQQRIVLLTAGNRPFRGAFEPLLAEAPAAKLQAMLARLPAAQPHRTSRFGAPRWWNGAAAIVAAILIFLAGLGTDRLLLQGGSEMHSAGSQNEEDDWRQAVAQYLSLYTAETLASIPDDMSQRERELSIVGGKMRLALSVQRIALENALLKRAQVFEYDGKPLGQIAYLDPHDGPMALCFIQNGADSAPRVEQREGFNVVYWSQAGHTFMLIGKTSVARLQEFASTLSMRLTG